MDLQKSHELSIADTQFEYTEQKDFLKESGSVSFHRDSSDFGYSLQIWPRGTFSYSPEDGFSGEADKVLVTGKGKSGSVSTGLTNILERDKGKIRQNLKQHTKNVRDEKQKSKKTSPSWKWVIAGLAFMMVVGCFIYTKVNLFFKKHRR